MAAEDHDKISESEGLPFAFIVDLMKSVRDVMKIHKENLVAKVEEVFNKEFNKVEEKKEEEEDNIFNADWFPLKFIWFRILCFLIYKIAYFYAILMHRFPVIVSYSLNQVNYLPLISVRAFHTIILNLTNIRSAFFYLYDITIPDRNI